MAMAVVFIPRTAYSQQSSATVNGTVRDPSGAVIDGATITLTNLDTAVSRNSVSNSAGDYVFIDVQPASYSLKAVKTGFTTQTQQPVVLSVNQTATLSFTLTVGSTQQSVTVGASAIAIESSTASSEPSLTNKLSRIAAEWSQLHPVAYANPGRQSH